VIATILRAIVPARFRPIRYLENLAYKRGGGRVPQGPFSGMRYIRGSVGSAYVPKLLGIYERELIDYVEQACASRFSLIVDIGAAEGYYAVGMSLRNPNATVIAFEMEERGRRALQEMAALNGVASRIQIRDKCSCADLRAALGYSDRALIICDVEGDEEKLLDPAAVPALARTQLLVETHDFVSRGVTKRLIERFNLTHKVRRIWQEARSQKEMPYRTLVTAVLPRRYLTWAVSEWRPEKMSWLWMEPRTSGNATA
jgi:predicted O-methyltransferase YrrM